MSINWTVLILESDEDLMELSSRIDTAVNGKAFDTFATSALTLLATTVTRQLTAATIARFVSRAIPQMLVRNSEDVPDLRNNVRVDYSIFFTMYNF